MTEVIIRKAKLEDLKKLQELATRTVKRSCETFLNRKDADHFMKSGMFDKELEQNLKYCELIEISDKIIGFSIMIGSFIHLLIIDYPFHRLGYGKKLLKHMESKLKNNLPFAQIETFKENNVALSFYKKNNWKVVKEEIDKSLGLEKLYLQKQIV